VGPGAGLDAVEKRIISIFDENRTSIRGRPATILRSQALGGLVVNRNLVF
jgi:hypothetical protein